MRKHGRLSASSMRIVLFGSEGGFSRPVLEQLFARDLCVSAVVMQAPLAGNSDFPVGIRQAIKPDSLEQLAIKNKLSVLKTHSLNDAKFIQQLTEMRADLLLVACFAQKIPAGIWQNMNLPCWNLHPSLLPKYRGPSPLHWQIKNNETSTGLTLHEVTKQLDAGDIVARQALPLPAKHDNHSLNNWVSEHGVELFYQALIDFVSGKLKPQAQDETMASYYPYAC